MTTRFETFPPGTRWQSASLYGLARRLIQGLVLALAVFLAGSALAASKPVQIVCLGDSLTAGYLLPPDAAFPVVLETALKAQGLSVAVSNAGVSGDTSSGGLERLDWAVPEGTDLVIVELGANDMLRGLDPKIPAQALDTIITRLKARNIRVLLAGMVSASNYGADYQARFDAIYPALSARYHLPLYPFFLKGVSGVPGMTLPDGLHPTRAGVERMVQGILPVVRDMIAAK